MRGMKTSRAIGEIDEKFIEEAAPGKRITVKVFPWKATAIAACLALVICIGTMAVMFGKSEFETADETSSSSQQSSTLDSSESKAEQSSAADSKSDSKTDSSSDSKTDSSTVTPDDSSKPDIAKEATWAEMSSSERFNELKQSYNFGKRITFHSRNAEISKEKTGAMLYNTCVEGYDFRTETTHHALADVYSINGISTSTAVAVVLIDDPRIDELYSSCGGDYVKIRERLGISDEGGKYIVYINPAFEANDLYSFAMALGLKTEASYPNAYRTEENGKTVSYSGIDRSSVWDLLFANGANDPAVSDPDGFLTKGEHKTLISLSVDCEAIGSSNLSITLTEDGYLVTNLLSSARVYNIGKVKTERFVNYVLANGSGKQIDTDSTESSQAAA